MIVYIPITCSGLDIEGDGEHFVMLVHGLDRARNRGRPAGVAMDRAAARAVRDRLTKLLGEEPPAVDSGGVHSPKPNGPMPNEVWNAPSAQLLSRRATAQMRGYEGDPCPDCGNLTLVRSGTCLKCDTCGSTTGCS